MSETTESAEAPVRVQHVWNPVTKQREQIKVRSIKNRFRTGKGGALKGAKSEADRTQQKVIGPGKPPKGE